eukprot:1189593-Prorocentrum_minimum.AAC.7
MRGEGIYPLCPRGPASCMSSGKKLAEELNSRVTRRLNKEFRELPPGWGQHVTFKILGGGGS